MIEEDVENGNQPMEVTESILQQQQSKQHRRRIFSSTSRSKYLENSLADRISQTAEVANQSAVTSDDSAGQIIACFALMILIAIMYGAWSLVFR